MPENITLDKINSNNINQLDDFQVNFLIDIVECNLDLNNLAEEIELVEDQISSEEISAPENQQINSTKISNISLKYERTKLNEALILLKDRKKQIEEAKLITSQMNQLENESNKVLEAESNNTLSNTFSFNRFFDKQKDSDQNDKAEKNKNLTP